MAACGRPEGRDGILPPELGDSENALADARKISRRRLFLMPFRGLSLIAAALGSRDAGGASVIAALLNQPPNN